MKKQIFILLLCFVMLFGTACQGAPTVPPSSDQATGSSSPAETTEAPAVTTETSETTEAPVVTPESPEEEPVLPEKRVFDKDEVYRHVFEKRSIPLSEEELETFEIHWEKGEAVISYYFDIDWETGIVGYREDYFVRGITTETSGHPSKYYVNLALSSLNPGSHFPSYVSHDYHEAYLDVLFENLTFSPCESLPDRTQERVSKVGWISFDGMEYIAFSDWYLYYEKTDENGEASYFRSDQTVDVPYLTGLILNALQYKRNQKMIDPQIYYNQIIEVKEPYEIRTVERSNGETRTYYVDPDGVAYLFNDQPTGGVLWQNSMEDGICIYANFTHVYHNTELIFR